MGLRIMMVATVNEEGSSCSKLAANFSQLDYASIAQCCHTKMHLCCNNATLQYISLLCYAKLDYSYRDIPILCCNTAMQRCINIAMHC